MERNTDKNTFAIQSQVTKKTNNPNYPFVCVGMSSHKVRVTFAVTGNDFNEAPCYKRLILRRPAAGTGMHVYMCVLCLHPPVELSGGEVCNDLIPSKPGGRPSIAQEITASLTQ